MKVLSLFDGMSCGMIAFRQLGIKVDRYVAYEIEPKAIETSQHNFPEIEQMGDVFKADFTKYKGFDWLVGGSPCFAEGHMVLTDKGYKDISEIEIGDRVLTHKNRYKPVVRLYRKKAETVKLNIQGYPEIITTDNHPFYTIKRSKCTYSEYKKQHTWRKFSAEPEWTKVQDMTKDIFCGQHLHKSAEVNDYNLSCEDCYILGRYVADGHLRKSKRPNRENSYQYQLVLSIGESKLKDFTANIKENHFSCYKHSQSVYRCVFASKRLVEIAEHFGRGAVNKEIPEFVYDLPMEMIGAFIAGYISGDGSYIEQWDEWTTSTVSFKLALGLQRLIGAYYKTNVGISKDNNIRQSVIAGRAIKSNYPLYIICFKTGIRKQSVAHIQNDIIWTNVKRKIPTYKAETVYNIEVADDNSYTVNNCIVHNCTYWSIAQTNNRETQASGMGWELFSQYVRALQETKPKYFIYENNKSMSNEIRDSIRNTFGFEEVLINSALVSAQNRQRYYWVGKRNADGTYSKVDVQQPKDRGILLKDILEGITDREKGRAVIGSAGRTTTREYFKKQQGSMAFEPVNTTKNGKASTMMAGYHKYGVATMITNKGFKGGTTGVAEPVNAYYSNNAGGFEHRMFSENPNKQQVDMIAEPIECNWMQRKIKNVVQKNGYLPEIFNPYNGTEIKSKCPTLTTGCGGWTTSATVCVNEPVRIGCMPSPSGELKNGQGNRIYSAEGKAVGIKANAGGAGAKTGLYAIPIEWDNEGIPTKAISLADGKPHTVYEVRENNITIKGKEYPIKLVDGYYIVRKLTVKECMRLQTVPEWYEFPVSDTASYRLLGNGWTCEVIMHLIRACLANKVAEPKKFKAYDKYEQIKMW